MIALNTRLIFHSLEHYKKCTQDTNDKFNLDDSIEDLLNLMYSP